MNGQFPSDDVVRLLEKDHRTVEELLGELDTAGTATRRASFWNLTDELIRHEVAEELVVYPGLRRLPGGDQIADTRISEQAEAEEQLAKMEKLDADSAEFASELGKLKAAVLEHAKSEVETAFTMLTSSTTPEDRAELGRRDVEAKDAAPTHPHPPSPDALPGNATMGSVAALVDRVRDAAASA